MIINALCEYYDILSENSDAIAKENFSSVEVNFAITLSKDGELLDFVDLRESQEETKGKKIIKKLVPKKMMVPEHKSRSTATSPYFLVDTGKYILGFDEKGNKSEPQYNSFENEHVNRLENCNDAGAKALLNFLNKRDTNNTLSKLEETGQIKDILASKNIVFKLDGELGYIHNRPALQKIWEDLNSQINDENKYQCLVSGKDSVIARTHPKIKGVWGAQSAGASLVSFNEKAYESYEKDQSYNAPVSEKSAFKYATVLNYMLEKSSKQKIQIADATTVFWAQSEESIYNDIVSQLFNTSFSNELSEDEEKTEVKVDKKYERKIFDILDSIKQGINLSNVGLEENTKFCILGLSPNNARLSVRFFHRDNFGDFIKKIQQHYNDLEIEGIPDRAKGKIPIWKILGETIVKQSKDKSASPLMAGALMRAIITGSNYPFDIYTAVLRRIKTEQDDREKNIYGINYIRVAVIKAYLKRKYRGSDKYKEELQVSLNEESTDTAYLLGRLFSMLERTQEDSVRKDDPTKKLNKTIKDSYFSSANASPGAVFPILMKLKKHHISKLEEKGIWHERIIGEIIDKLELPKPFPMHLNLEEQGLFILGYYHQRQSFFRKKEDKQTENIEQLQTV